LPVSFQFCMSVPPECPVCSVDDPDSHASVTFWEAGSGPMSEAKPGSVSN
jgi:hypothetical protein